MTADTKKAPVVREHRCGAESKSQHCYQNGQDQ